MFDLFVWTESDNEGPKQFLVDTFSKQNQARNAATSFAQQGSVVLNEGLDNEEVVPMSKVIKFEVRASSP